MCDGKSENHCSSLQEEHGRNGKVQGTIKKLGCSSAKEPNPGSTNQVEFNFLHVGEVRSVIEGPIRTTVALLDRHLPVITGEEWELIRDLVVILQPLEEATTQISAQTYMTASMALIISDGLTGSYEDMLATKNKGTMAANIIEAILKELGSRFRDLENSKSLCLATFLDPRFKVKPFSQDGIVKQTTKMETHLAARGGLNTCNRTASFKPRSKK